MGFELNLLVVLPTTCKIPPKDENWLDKDKKPVQLETYTLWTIEAVLAIGSITRLDKLVNPHFSHIHDQYPPKVHAGICAGHQVYTKLVAERVRKWTKANFAPAFSKNDYPEKMKAGSVLVEPRGETPEDVIPSHELLQKHNQTLELPPRKFEKYVKGNDYRIVMDAPLLWEDALTVGNWFKELLHENWEFHKVLTRKKKAPEHVELWSNYLLGMGKLDAKVIFVFDSVRAFSIV